jgi:hypothetical protein
MGAMAEACEIREIRTGVASHLHPGLGRLNLFVRQIESHDILQVLLLFVVEGLDRSTALLSPLECRNEATIIYGCSSVSRAFHRKTNACMAEFAILLDECMCPLFVPPERSRLRLVKLSRSG